MTDSLSLDLRTYALAGAQARLTEMAQEADAIRRAFPELRDGQGTGRNASREDSADTPTRRRGGMSAAQRKAVGTRMKKYWAARRPGAKGTETAASESATTTPTAARGAAKRGPRTMSPAARKRISDAQKKRWAAKRKTA